VAQTETNLTAEKPPLRPPGTAYWLITNGRRDVLTLDYAGEKMLPVFGHPEEAAEMLLQLGARAAAGVPAGAVPGSWCRPGRNPYSDRRGTSALLTGELPRTPTF
jgi:hypothetical protein